MKKFTWIFGLALLWGGLNAVAQTVVKEVGDFDHLTTAVKNIPVFSNVEKLRTLYNDAKTGFTAAKKNYDDAKYDAEHTPEEITTTSSTTVYEDDYFREYERFYEATAGDNLDVQPVPKMQYGFKRVSSGRNDYYYVIFFTRTDFNEKITDTSIKWEPTEILPINIYWPQSEEGQEEEQGNPDYLDILDGFTANGITYNKVNYGCFYYIDDNGNIALGKNVSLNGATNVVSAFLATWNGSTRLQAISKPTTTKTDNTVAYNAAQRRLTLATTELYEKERARNTARTNFNDEAKNIAEKKNTEIQYDEDSLVICEKQYKTINITADFAASSIVADEWPAGYTLNGNGHIIETTSALFKTNSGEINGLATPNGHIANSNPGTVTLSLTKWDKKYRVYTPSGDYETHDTAEDAIYSMRDEEDFLFGYNVQGKKVQKLDDNTKLYQAKYANADNKTVYTFKLNIQKDEDEILKYNKDTFEPKFNTTDINYQNAILYIDNADAKAMVKDMKNVAVMENGVYNCYNTVLEDGANVKEFYIPFDFKSKKLNYTRSFNQKVAAVCFPFALTNALKTTFGIENIYQFNDVDEGTGVMWFTYLSTIGANKPCLISFPEEEGKGVIFKDIETTLDFKAIQDGDMILTNAFGSFYGNYASKTPADLLGGGSKDALYAVQKGWLVKTDVNNKNSRLHQFRSYVVRPYSSNEAPSYKIGLMDEDGNEVTAIETVSGEVVTGFKAKGGDNAIEITTTEACPVKVYALNGALVKSTRVEAGTTSLPVKAGIYVVNGAKVIVK